MHLLLLNDAIAAAERQIAEADNRIADFIRGLDRQGHPESSDLAEEVLTILRANLDLIHQHLSLMARQRPAGGR